MKRSARKRKAARHMARKILLILCAALLCFLVFLFCKAMWYGRGTSRARAVPGRIELSYEEATADGSLSFEEIAVHYAPEVRAAVNVLISESGKGDFISAVDFDGDTSAVNNWENMASYPLKAYVYWSVQETDTHYFVGYYFYHPRDDAEIWLDKHENDFEGIMLAVPKIENGFAPPVCMYTQGHGGVPFYGDNITMTEGSVRGGPLALDGDRAVIYITPNGTLNNAGHSIESAAGHSTYWSVGNSGVRYYHGGEAQVPASFKGDYNDNPCSYALLPLKELWDRRNGPYGEGGVFADFGAFHGDNYRKNAANPPWGWRNKTVFGFGGSFLSDPAWTFSRAVEEYSFSCDYISNEYADWKVSVRSVSGAGEAFTLRLWQGAWQIAADEWWSFEKTESGEYAVRIRDAGRQSVWVAAPPDTVWKCEAVDGNGNVPENAVIDWEAEFLGQ